MEVFYIMVESDDEDPSTRKTDEIKEATTFFKEYLGVEPTVTNAVRIGKVSKPQLLKSAIQNLDDKVPVLQSKMKLKGKKTLIMLNILLRTFLYFLILTLCIFGLYLRFPHLNKRMLVTVVYINYIMTVTYICM